MVVPWSKIGGYAVVALAVMVTACQPPPSMIKSVAPSTVIEPAYAFSLGAHLRDVRGALGPPRRGPIYDRFSDTLEVVYSFDRAIVAAETRLPNGVVRTEMVDRVHMFFDANEVLVRMAHEPDRNYAWFSSLPLHRITVRSHITHSVLQ